MRTQHRIAASVAVVLLLSAAVTTTAAMANATADVEAADDSLVEVPSYPLRPFRFGAGERYLTAVALPPAVVVPVAFAGLRQCESGGDYAANTGNGYYGAYQFSLSTWRSLGYAGHPHEAPAATQDEAAVRLQARSGWGQWPSCSRRLGLR